MGFNSGFKGLRRTVRWKNRFSLSLFSIGGFMGVHLPKRLNKFVNCVTFSNDLLPEVRLG